MEDVVLLVGLGNPGKQYENNRHNVGFKVIDTISEKMSSSLKKMITIVETGSFAFEGKRIILAKPQTYMNLSGRAVKFLVDFYKISITNVFVFHDDIDLDFAKVKIKNGGGNGGHNGLKSIDSIVGNDYWRVRIGVGRPERKSEVSSYVLHDFNRDEEKIISQIYTKISDNILMLFNDYKNLEVFLKPS